MRPTNDDEHSRLLQHLAVLMRPGMDEPIEFLDGAQDFVRVIVELAAHLPDEEDGRNALVEIMRFAYVLEREQYSPTAAKHLIAAVNRSGRAVRLLHEAIA